MSHMQRLLVTYLFCIIDNGLIEVRSGPIQSNSLYNRIKWILQAEAFLLLQSK